MPTFDPGQDRCKLRFREQAEAAFSFLVREYGFRLIDAKDTILRYESANVYVNIVHGRGSFEIRIELGPRGSMSLSGEHFGLKEILLHKGLEGGQYPVFYQTSTAEGVKEGVAILSGILHTNGAEALRGDIVTFRELRAIQSEIAQAVTEEYRTRPLRAKAEQAWRDKDYALAVRLYESLGNDITPPERKRLLYARKKLGHHG